jgi:hypothetical protein
MKYFIFITLLKYVLGESIDNLGDLPYNQIPIFNDDLRKDNNIIQIREKIGDIESIDTKAYKQSFNELKCLTQDEPCNYYNPNYSNEKNRRKRIINPLPQNHYPYSTVAIEITHTMNGVHESICTGSILTPRVILTAAHCFVSRNGQSFQPPDPSQFYQITYIKVLLGVANKNMKNYKARNPLPYEQSITFDREMLRNIDQYVKINHNWYKSLAVKKSNRLKHGDIALIVLPDRLRINLEKSDS